MKREKTILLSSSSSSSSSYRERGAAAAAAMTPDGHSSCLHSQSIGCMSGLFHLLSRYQHRRKSLTYGFYLPSSFLPHPPFSFERMMIGKRQQKNTLVSPPTKDTTADIVPSLLRGGADGSRNDGSPTAADKRISCEVPRSPTLPAEIRRSRLPVGRAAPQPTPPPPTRPTVVARLMGLTAGDAPESAAEKRRELLGALDKCDRDLKALKRIIDVVRSSEQLRHEQGAAKPNASFDGRLQELAKEDEGGGEAEGDSGGDSGDNENSNSGGEEQQQEPPEQAAEQPSPVSVLDEFTRSTPISGYTKRHSSAERLVPPPQRKKPGEDLSCSICLLDRIAYEPSPVRARSGEGPFPAPPPSWVSEAMRQSVEQVCRDIAWGQRREVGRIGMALHDHICRDLIEETVREMGSSRCIVTSSPLPFDACKRRLRF